MEGLPSLDLMLKPYTISIPVFISLTLVLISDLSVDFAFRLYTRILFKKVSVAITEKDGDLAAIISL